jgi:ribonucleotide reductase alpha subunit
MTKQTRKIGLGIMGFADLLIALNTPYNSEAALHTATTLMDFFRSRAHLTPAGLAAERGVIPAYRGSRLQAQHQPHRNATVTTIAPTGSISLIAGCSPGIEPLYGVQEVRRIMDGVLLTSLHPAFVRRARTLGLNLDSLRPDLAAHPSIQHLTHIPEELRRLFVTAHDVSPEQHVRMHRCFSDLATAVSRKPSICRPRQPKPRWPQPVCSHTNSDAKTSPSFVQATGNDKSFPAAPLIPAEPRLLYSPFLNKIDTTRRW